MVASGKEPACQCRRQKRCGFHPWVGKIPWRRKCQPLQCSCLENPMDRGACQATARRVAKSQTRLKRLSTHAQPSWYRWLVHPQGKKRSSEGWSLPTRRRDSSAALLTTSGANDPSPLRFYPYCLQVRWLEFCYRPPVKDQLKEQAAGRGSKERWFPGTQSPRIKLPIFAPVCRQERIERKTEWRGSRWGRPSYGKCGSWSPRMAPKEPHLLGPMPLCAAPSRIGPGGPVTHWPKECGGSDIMSSVRLNPKGATCLLSLLGSFLLLSRFLLEYNCFWAYQVLQQEGICLPRQETQETWVWPLGRADPLEKETVTHSSILAWRMPRGVWWAMCPRVAKELNTT